MAVGRTRNCTADFLANLMADKPTAGSELRPEEREKGQTLPSRHGEPEPRLPHERDLSSDSQPGIEDERIHQAARDLEEGQQDTGRTPVVTELARQEFPSDADKKNTP